MKTRIDLQQRLEAMMLDLGYKDCKDRVYFQPPSGFMLKYPCIIYKLEGDQRKYANDAQYNRKKRYGITAISKDPDSPLQDKPLELPYCSFNDVFTADNLYHYCFTIYI